MEDIPWKTEHLDQLKQHFVIKDDPRWARLICVWNEAKSDGKLLNHQYAVCIDTIEWGMYLDCRPFKIWTKCFSQLLARPLHILIKTIYHLSLARIVYEGMMTWQKLQTVEDCRKHCLKSLADIIRTPLYGLALITTSIALLVIAPFSLNLLYSGRTLIGKIEQMANWGEIHTAWTLTSCFQPFPMSILNHYNKDHNFDTLYLNHDPLEKALSNFARSLINYERNNFDYFDCQKLHPDYPYISPIIENQDRWPYKNPSKLPFQRTLSDSAYLKLALK